ncbi:SURF1 family protein [Candidatus Pelagibacter ubique]|nr:SURF1 family protein [Candidatus Pelagibacter bacterium]MDA7450049.1 SURF1 family protein [Candidatus Pelagibacter ubique]MDA9202907.1 SURF1 family protein [Candidatus Pelagibacter ubique]MDB2693327.1 SURF1 family protein [Candidatus Pelagibacter bacterium]MDB9768154.1 SURF1 family protein [Candidatus Pelagibacter ubique]MDC0951972.1 SURF1 family protein [Candidatus Pelagibacter ubique]
MRYKFLFSIFVFFFISVFLALGSWQIIRLNWKLELINQIESSLKDIPVNLSNSKHKNYLRIKTRGSIDFEKQIYLYNLNEKGKPGFEVINPLKVGNNNYLLNRGWIPFNKKEDETINVIDENYINGVLKKQIKPNMFKPENDLSENYWFTLDRDDIFKFTGKNFSPYVIYLSGNNEFPKPKSITANISNNHKKYALTWFSLAISILLIYLYLRKKNY